MSEYEYQESINARTAANRETEEKRAEFIKEVDQANRQAKLSRAKRKANKALAKRVVIALVVCAVLTLAQIAGLIDWHLSVPIMAAAMIWVAVWSGAWIQYRFCKGGLFEC